jgi:hypothetical protein
VTSASGTLWLTTTKGDKLRPLRKRALLIGAGAVCVFLLLAGALLLPPPLPYAFMRGARLEDVSAAQIQIFIVGATGPSSTPTPPMLAFLRYRTSKSPSTIENIASPELAKHGWGAPKARPYGNQEYWIYARGANESIQVIPDEEGGCYIHLIAPATSLDRIKARLWDLTHR